MFKILLLLVSLTGIQKAERGDYDAALPLLNISQKEVLLELHHKFYFYKAVAEYQSLQKEKALDSLDKFWNVFNEPPKRYAALAIGMQNDMQNWGKDPLEDIARKMGDVSRRLEQNRAGQLTQSKQQDIIRDIDRLIKEQEDAKNKAEADAQAKKDKGNQQTPGQGKIKTDQNAPDSIIMGGQGKGEVDVQKLKQIAETWGTLPPAKRAQVVQDLTRELPPKFEPLIKSYFEALNRKHNLKP